MGNSSLEPKTDLFNMSQPSLYVPPSPLLPIPKLRCHSPSSITSATLPSPHLVLSPPPPSFTPSRSFNSITLHGSLVIKSSMSPSLHGELFFYQHVPPSLVDLFPRLHWHKLCKNRLSFAIDRIPATTFSSCLVHGALSDRSLGVLLHSLTNLHHFQSANALPRDTLVYSSYATKVAMRFEAHRKEYQSIGLPPAHFNALLPMLRAYERQRRGRPARVIHGDPVLTNVLACVDGDIKLIDMRGAQGETLTLAGDAVYDVGKVVQSLSGYDHILAEVKMDKFVQARLRRAQGFVRRYVQKVYEVAWKDVVLVVCSLFTSLIPLHEEEKRKRMFAKVAESLLQCLLRERFGEDDIVEKVAEVLRDDMECDMAVTE